MHAEGNVALLIPLSSNALRLRFASTFLIKPSKANGLAQPSIALVFQVRAVDQKRVRGKIGTLSAADKRTLDKVIRAITRLA